MSVWLQIVILVSFATFATVHDRRGDRVGWAVYTSLLWVAIIIHFAARMVAEAVGTCAVPGVFA